MFFSIAGDCWDGVMWLLLLPTSMPTTVRSGVVLIEGSRPPAASPPEWGGGVGIGEGELLMRTSMTTKRRKKRNTTMTTTTATVMMTMMTMTMIGGDNDDW